MFKRSFFQFSLIFLLASSLGDAVYALDYGDVTATLDRTNPSQLILTVKLNNATTADQSSLGIVKNEAGEVQQALANHLDICIAATATQASCGETDTKVKYASGRIPPQTGAYVSNTQSAATLGNGTFIDVDSGNPTIHSYRISYVITDTTPFTVGQKVLLRLFPDKVAANLNKDKFDIVTKLGSGVQEAVETIGAFSTPASLIASWTAKPTVTFIDGSVASPNGVIGLLIPRANDSNTAVFPAKTFVTDPTQTAATSTSCQITTEGLGTDAASCTASCDNKTDKLTFDLDAIAAQGLRTNTVNDPSATSLGFDKVTVADGPYAIVLQYLPEGTAFSCVIGTPSDAATLVQLSGGPAPKPGDPSCFIATAAYGSALDPHIDVLRWFRDAYLLKTTWGRGLVHSYYKRSPPFAAWIADHAWARSVTRGLLWTPVLLLETLRDHAVWLGLGLVLLCSLLWQRRLVHSRKGLL